MYFQRLDPKATAQIDVGGIQFISLQKHMLTALSQCIQKYCRDNDVLVETI